MAGDAFVNKEQLFALNTTIANLFDLSKSNTWMVKAIEKSNSKFLEKFKRRWYDNHDPRTGTQKAPNMDGKGFYRKTGTMFDSISIIRDLNVISKSKMKVSFGIATSRPDRLPIRNIRYWGRFGNKNAYFHARTKGMDRWLSDNYSKEMKQTIAEKYLAKGLSFSKNTLAMGYGNTLIKEYQ